MIKKILFCVVALGYSAILSAQITQVPMDTTNWNMLYGEFTTHMGRTALSGAALVKDVVFEDGIIEVDITTTGERSYPGIIFRFQPQRDYEFIYLRPHRAGLYPDALQYVPAFNKSEGWQIYTGEGFTNNLNVDHHVWNTLRIEIKDMQAKVYWNNQPEAVLEIPELINPELSGSIGLNGPKNGSAYFSNFSYDKNVKPDINLPIKKDTITTAIKNWALSTELKAKDVDTEQYPSDESLEQAEWVCVSADVDGLVDVAKYRKRSAGGPDAIWARAIIKSPKRQKVKFSFGYSDAIDLFFNGNKVFSANNAYQYRDPSSVGVMGYFDHIYLEIEKGENELFFYLSEVMGGWGFKFKSDVLLEQN